MNYDNKSNYAINKKTEDIVYPFADGTVKYYRKENGKIYEIITDAKTTKMVELASWEMTVEQFDWMKVLSDTDYHESELHGKRTTRQNVSINKMMETNCIANRSAEQEYFDYLAALEAPPETKTYDNAIKILNKCLTEKQKRRFLLLHYHGLSTRQIAAMEGSAQRTIMDSIELAEKKIKKFFLKS